MILSRNLGMVLLGVWLLLSGLLRVLGASLPSGGMVLGLLALVSGGILLLNGAGTGARNPGFLLLSIWLILTGLIALITLRVTGLSVIMSLLELGAGIMLFVGARGRNLGRYPGILLLGIWLVISGLLGLITFSMTGLGTILGLLALVAGLLILLDH